MNKVTKIIIIFLVFDAIVIGGFFGYKAMTKKGEKSERDDYDWVTIDEYYMPADFVEEYIKNDSIKKELLPVSIRNYGRNTSILKKFRGKNFAGPNEAQLNMMYNGLQDWKLIDVKYKDKRKKEIQRTILYIQIEGEWKVGDSGTLAK